jgi:hypothetical protein
VRCADGIVHDVRVWRTPTTACGVVVFDSPPGVNLAALGFRVIRPGPTTEDPVDCMSCLVARRTPFAVLCDDHRQQFLTEEQYSRQLHRPDSFWSCPRCGESAHWDDDEYETAIDEGGPDAETFHLVDDQDDASNGPRSPTEI